ncbi:hypothetical protein EV363DRAFT_1457941 [Boletus edulis]|nr:hypothetical protein EV363DRAFT_1457941 [Boletus edulis]
MARRGMLQRRRKANWEKGVDKEGIQYLFLIAEDERAEQAHYAGIKYGPPRNIPKEKGWVRTILTTPQSSMARRGRFRRRKAKWGEGSRQGREPTPPPNHQDLRAELDNVDEAPNQPPRKVPQRKANLENGVEEGSRALSLINGTKGLTKNMLRAAESSAIPQRRDRGMEKGVEAEESRHLDLIEGDRRADLDRAEDGPLQKVQKEEGPEAERSQQRREPKTACRGRDSRSEVDADDTRIKDKGHQGAGSRRAREASLDEGDCMEQSKDNRIKYSQLKKGLKTTGDEGEGSQEKRKPTPRPDQREKRAEPDHEKGQEAEGSRQGREPSPRPVKWDGRAEINYPEDGRIKSGMPGKITKEKGQEGERHRQRRESTPGLDQVDARDERGYANDERGGQKKGPTSRLGHRQHEARVEKEHQTYIVKKGKGKEAEMSRQRLPADYARKDTTQGNMETIGDSSFDELPLFYADAGSASNKTIAKPVYQDDKVADLGRLPLKSAMKKPSHANTRTGMRPVGDSAETIRSKIALKDILGGNGLGG